MRARRTVVSPHIGHREAPDKRSERRRTTDPWGGYSATHGILDCQDDVSVAMDFSEMKRWVLVWSWADLMRERLAREP